MEEKKSGNKILVLVLLLVFGGFAVLFCGGVLAAIAIPAFVRYTSQSKAVEANMVTRQMADYAKMAYAETCTFPGELAPTAVVSECCGGEKCMPIGNVAEIWGANVGALWSPSYFSYTAVSGGPDKLTIVAEADFSCGGPSHTVTIEVTGGKDGETCNAAASSPVTTNEFE